MKRSTFIALLYTVAVVIIFTATGCKSHTLFGSGIPKEPGDYIDLGNGWQKIPSGISVFPGFGLPAAEFDRFAIPIPRGCQSIKYAYRFTPTEATNIGSTQFQVQFGQIGLCSARRKDESSQPGGYVYVAGDITLDERQCDDHSVYEGKDPYILVGYPLPDYPPGEYFLGKFGSGCICLRRQ